MKHGSELGVTDPGLGPNGDGFDSPGRSPGNRSDVRCEAPTGRDITVDVREFRPVGAAPSVETSTQGCALGYRMAPPSGLKSRMLITPK